MDELIRFVMLAQSGRFTVSELCEQFGISRKTGYKHLERYAAEGLKGLAARSHRPHQFPQRTDRNGSFLEAMILHPSFSRVPFRARELCCGFVEPSTVRQRIRPEHLQITLLFVVENGAVQSE